MKKSLLLCLALPLQYVSADEGEIWYRANGEPLTAERAIEEDAPQPIIDLVQPSPNALTSDNTVLGPAVSGVDSRRSYLRGSSRYRCSGLRSYGYYRPVFYGRSYYRPYRPTFILRGRSFKLRF